MILATLSHGGIRPNADPVELGCVMGHPDLHEHMKRAVAKWGMALAKLLEQLLIGENELRRPPQRLECRLVRIE